MDSAVTMPVKHGVRAVVSDGLGYAVTTGTTPFEVRPSKPLFGFAAGPIANFATLNAEVGPVQVRRSYLPPSTQWSVTPYMVNQTTMMSDMLEGRASIWSWKPNPTEFARGTYDNDFKALLGSIKHMAYIGLWHEPGDQFRKGLFTPEQWRAANNRMGKMIHDNGNPRIKSFICLEGRWALTDGTKDTGGLGGFSYWDDGMAQNIDFIAFDQYTSPTLGPDAIEVILTTRKPNMVDSPMGWARTRGKPVLIPEWGVSEAWGPIEKARRVRSFWQWCKQQNDVKAVSYFHNLEWMTSHGSDARAALRAMSDDAKA